MYLEENLGSEFRKFSKFLVRDSQEKLTVTLEYVQITEGFEFKGCKLARKSRTTELYLE